MSPGLLLDFLHVHFDFLEFIPRPHQVTELVLLLAAVSVLAADTFYCFYYVLLLLVSLTCYSFMLLLW